jgi:hypothetical protein
MLCDVSATRYDLLMNIILRFVDICLFRAGPADIPASRWLMKLSLFVYFSIGLLAGRIDSQWLASFSSSFADTLALLVFVGIALQIKQQQSRYLQTVTALAGTGSLLTLLSMPVLYAFSLLKDPSQASSLIMLAIMALVFWSLMVTAHIFRQALDIKAGMAAVITVVYTLLSILVVGLVMSGVA